MPPTPATPLSPPNMRVPGGLLYWSLFSRDGKRIFAGGATGEVWIWDAENYTLIDRMPAGASVLRGASLHPTLDRIAAGCEDGSVLVLDLDTGEPLVRSRQHRASEGGRPGGVLSTCFTADGSIVVSGGYDGTVRLTDAVSGARAGRLKRLGWDVRSVAAAPDLARFAAAYHQGIRAWDRDCGDVFSYAAVYAHGGECAEQVAFDGSGRLWAVLRGSPQVRCWDLAGETGAPSAEIDLGAAAFGMAFSRDHRLLAVALDHEIALVPVETREVAARWVAPNGDEQIQSPVQGLSFSPDGRRLLSCDIAGGLWVWPVPASGT